MATVNNVISVPAGTEYDVDRVRLMGFRFQETGEVTYEGANGETVTIAGATSDSFPDCPAKILDTTTAAIHLLYYNAP